MSFIIGKLSRKVSKQHNEYFVGKIGGIPIRASWAKKGQDDLCIFLDSNKINFLSEKNKAASGAGAQQENKQ